MKLFLTLTTKGGGPMSSDFGMKTNYEGETI